MATRVGTRPINLYFHGTDMDRPFIIGITGGSGSGKTSLIRKLKNAFTEGSITVLSQDDYYVPMEEQFVDDHGVHNFDLPTAINILEFVIIHDPEVSRPE